VLRESVEEVRLLADIDELRAMLSLGDLRQILERHGVLMMELPQKLDEALALAAEGREQGPRGPAEAAGENEWREAWAFAVTSLLALAAVALMTRYLAGPLGRWAERAGAFTFVILGGMLLRAARRMSAR
jgi:hypothetical protein